MFVTHSCSALQKDIYKFELPCFFPDHPNKQLLLYFEN